MKDKLLLLAPPKDQHALRIEEGATKFQLAAFLALYDNAPRSVEVLHEFTRVIPLLNIQDIQEGSIENPLFLPALRRVEAALRVFPAVSDFVTMDIEQAFGRRSVKQIMEKKSTTQEVAHMLAAKCQSESLTVGQIGASLREAILQEGEFFAGHAKQSHNAAITAAAHAAVELLSETYARASRDDIRKNIQHWLLHFAFIESAMVGLQTNSVVCADEPGAWPSEFIREPALTLEVDTEDRYSSAGGVFNVIPHSQVFYGNDRSFLSIPGMRFFYRKLVWSFGK
jgi:hypothetical protein